MLTTSLAAFQMGSDCDLLYLKTVRQLGLPRGALTFEGFSDVALTAATLFFPSFSADNLLKALVAMLQPAAERKGVHVADCLKNDDTLYL